MKRGLRIVAGMVAAALAVVAIPASAEHDTNYLALGELRAAAPSAEIIVMTYYDPYAAVAPQSLAITHALNNAITTAAAAHGVRVADAFSPINLAQPQPATLCALTLVCTALHDIHASDAGYAVIAQQFWAASDYGP